MAKKSLLHVAILLASYNGLEKIEAQLNSIVAQVGVKITIFISDDMSIDGLWEYLESILIAEVVFLPRLKRFGCAGANFFRLLQDVSFEGFDYVAFADQDDIWANDKLIRAITVLEQGAATMYSSNVTAFWADGREMLINKAQPQQKWDHYFEAAGPGCTYVMPSGIAKQLKQTIIQHADTMSSIALHDWFIYAWARHNGLVWFIDPIPRMRYRQHATNVVGVNNGFKAAKSRFNKLCDGWYLSQIKLISNVIGSDGVPPIKWIKNPSFLNKLKLLFSASSCRRRFRDRLGFVVFILMLSKHEK